MLNIIKKFAALLVVCAILCGFAGCGKSETGISAVSSSSSEPKRVLADTSKFDFDAAMKDINLFGKKILFAVLLVGFRRGFFA